MMTRCHQMTGQQRRSGHPEKQWYLMQERRDSRLILPPSCPTDGVHFMLRLTRITNTALQRITHQRIGTVLDSMARLGQSFLGIR